MNKYGIAGAIIAGALLVACSGSDDDLMARARRERDVRAIALCQDYARSVSYTHLTLHSVSYTHLTLPTICGSVIAASTFTAKNGFGLELKYEVACQVNGSGVVEAGIREARD
ncbi:hypothetical protein [Burkholderia pseudomallei]|uniref:hypothetical protein n=1 Tax=Burkholderia pseudomallei TaxID=28450 RepID=UPI000DD01839|nr:hypothetical protein [Burkholderia pseudomallei]